MIRTLLTPDNTNIYISIPKNYVGKKLEVLLYALDELALKPHVQKNKMAKYKGILSPKTAELMQKYVEQSRNEWERNI